MPHFQVEAKRPWDASSPQPGNSNTKRRRTTVTPDEETPPPATHHDGLHVVLRDAAGSTRRLDFENRPAAATLRGSDIRHQIEQQVGSCAHFTLAYAHDLSAVTDLDTVACGTVLLYACTPVPVPQPFPTTLAPAAPPQPQPQPSAMACSPPPVAAGITVFVKTISGRKQSLGPIDPQMTTALQIKHMLRELEGAPVEQLRLIFSGRQLADDQALATYGVGHGMTIHSVLQLRGGGAAETGAWG